MITEPTIRKHLETHLEGTPLFPVEIHVRSGNRILVTIDGDQGVTIEDCKALNRFLEAALDREKEDFELTVSSSGADRPLIFPRQYPRHKGRELHLSLSDGSEVSGKLVEASEDSIVIEPSGGKKDPVREPVTIPFSSIREALIVLPFKKQ